MFSSYFHKHLFTLLSVHILTGISAFKSNDSNYKSDMTAWYNPPSVDSAITSVSS